MPSTRRPAHPISRSLRTKVTLGVLIPLTLILGAFTELDVLRHQQATLANLSLLVEQTTTVIRNSLRQVVLAGNPQAVQKVLSAIGEDQTIRVLYVLDTSGRVVYAARPEEDGQRLDNRAPTCMVCHRLPPAERPADVVVRLPGGERVFRSMTPIPNRPECYGCHDASQPLLGVMLTDISMAPLEASLASDLRLEILWWAGSIVVIALVVNLALNRMVIQRLRRVGQGLSRFGQGQLGLRLADNSPDEIGQLSAAFNDMGDRLQSQSAENEALSADLRRQGAVRQGLLKRLIRAQEEERRRVARDLHDDLGQQLAGLAAQLQGAERLWAESPERALDLVREGRALIAEATEHAYDLILRLRPSMLDDLGLAAALRSQADRSLKDSGITYELDASHLDRRLPAEIETALFRTYQEALNNVVRHSGARHVRMRLAAVDGAFEGEIADDGRGFDPQALKADGQTARGLGLLGMQERMAQCGGSLEIASRPGAGVRLRIRIPIPEKGDG